VDLLIAFQGINNHLDFMSLEALILINNKFYNSNFRYFTSRIRPVPQNGTNYLRNFMEYTINKNLSSIMG